MKVHLTRPLAVFDIESTGINRKTDRIIDLAIVILAPDGSPEKHAFRVNPGVPIPAESSAIHGILDQDVADCPFFKDIAPEIVRLLEGCDLCGFNILHFDIPILCEEFARSGITTFSMDNRRVLDVQRIFHRKEPRDLSAALRFYCGTDHEQAHGALADVEATIQVLEGQFERYEDLPVDMDELDAYCNPRDPSWADRSGRLKWVDGELAINFGKNQGRHLRELVKLEPSFLTWITKNDFPNDTRALVQGVLDGVWPEPPPTP